MTQKMIKLSFTIPKEHSKVLDKVAAEVDTSKTRLIRNIIKIFVLAHEK